MKREREDDEASIVSISSDTSISDDGSSDEDLLFVGVTLHGQKFRDANSSSSSELSGKVKKEEDDEHVGSNAVFHAGKAVKEEDEDEKDVKPVISESELTPGGLPHHLPAGQSHITASLDIPEQSRSKFNCLPREIKYVILRHVNTDPFSVLSLSMVSKSWYRVLYEGPEAEPNWEERCRILGAQEQLPGCGSWRQTFIKWLHETCLNCLRSSKTEFGHVLAGQPDWLTVCTTCQTIPGPWQTIPEREARRRNRKGYSRLPFLIVKITGRNPRASESSTPPKLSRGARKYLRKASRRYLASAAGDPFDGQGSYSLKMIRSQLLDMHKTYEASMPKLHNGPKDILLYLDAVESGKAFCSRRLFNMASALASGDRQRRLKESLKDTCEDALQYLEKLKELNVQLQAYKVSHAHQWTKSRHRSIVDLRKHSSRSWIDKVITGQVQWRDGKAPGDPDLHALYERKSKLSNGKRQKTTHGDSAEDRSCQGGCTHKKAVECEQKRCKTCCPGPCVRHDLARKIDLYSVKKEEED